MALEDGRPSRSPLALTDRQPSPVGGQLVTQPSAPFEGRLSSAAIGLHSVVLEEASSPQVAERAITRYMSSHGSPLASSRQTALSQRQVADLQGAEAGVMLETASSADIRGQRVYI